MSSDLYQTDSYKADSHNADLFQTDSYEADLYEARNSIYCYPNSNVLVNKLNIRDNKRLEEAEKQIVMTKLFELRRNKQIGNFDINHLINIHKFLFEDIYPFAGKFRTENIAKGYFSFANWEYIEAEVKKLLEQLKEDDYLKGNERNDFIKKLAYYQSELNVIHPFREGNGRTIREFIRQLAFVNGYIMDLQNATADELLEASIHSVSDTTQLEEVLQRCLLKTDF